jgi:hypothetical protein
LLLLLELQGESPEALRRVKESLQALRRPSDSAADDDRRLQPFLRAANFFRYGNIRPAEEAARAITRPVLRRGTQLVLDGL